MAEDKCIVCGDAVPEGRIVCSKCDITGAVACTRTEKEYQTLLHDAEKMFIELVTCGPTVCDICNQSACQGCGQFTHFSWRR